jgi:hypothetical protein
LYLMKFFDDSTNNRKKQAFKFSWNCFKTKLTNKVTTSVSFLFILED